MNLTTTIEVDDREVWMAVFGSGFDQFSWWGRLAYESPADWETPGTAILEKVDPDTGASVGYARVTLDDLARAIEAAEDRTYWGTRLTDFEDYDAAVADALLQLVVYGEEVYA